MKVIPLTFYQRFSLAGAIGNFPVPKVKDAAMFVRLLEKVRLTEAERRGGKFRQEGQNVSWTLPDAGFGTKSIELEDIEAESLAQAIEALENIRVLDVEWLLKISEQLRAEEPEEQAA